MKRYNCAWVFALMIFSSTSWAYGGGGGGSSSSKACVKPRFTELVPAENAEVVPGSPFSFTASPNTYPTTIKVTVKGLPATINVVPQKEGTFEVSGTLPDTLKGVYARIAITADGQSNCKGTGGWLIKIAE